VTAPEEDYPCVGVCIDDADTGYCLGCGRPPPPVSLGAREYDAMGADWPANIEPVADLSNEKTG